MFTEISLSYKKKKNIQISTGYLKKMPYLPKC